MALASSDPYPEPLDQLWEIGRRLSRDLARLNTHRRPDRAALSSIRRSLNHLQAMSHPPSPAIRKSQVNMALRDLAECHVVDESLRQEARTLHETFAQTLLTDALIHWSPADSPSSVLVLIHWSPADSPSSVLVLLPISDPAGLVLSENDHGAQQQSSFLLRFDFDSDDSGASIALNQHAVDLLPRTPPTPPLLVSAHQVLTSATTLNASALWSLSTSSSSPHHQPPPQHAAPPLYNLAIALTTHPSLPPLPPPNPDPDTDTTTASTTAALSPTLSLTFDILAATAATTTNDHNTINTNNILCTLRRTSLAARYLLLPPLSPLLGSSSIGVASPRPPVVVFDDQRQRGVRVDVRRGRGRGRRGGGGGGGGGRVEVERVEVEKVELVERGRWRGAGLEDGAGGEGEWEWELRGLLGVPPGEEGKGEGRGGWGCGVGVGVGVLLDVVVLVVVGYVVVGVWARRRGRRRQWRGRGRGGCVEGGEKGGCGVEGVLLVVVDEKGGGM
ncbi:uncharacterized protein BKCO1_960003 [Diplodia corticola]|uniref:Uncharacterized protein n=1 Tax=Diplodia corticola TaxID=236234 RepID=A0A1J9QJK1_9PEZI|nr:uncharacterized protein BKCO1_960003 [Diplodia corticola]OJD29046.1 hypothetical protein BKCO1_960003 [Diplodia corticola]